MMGTKKIKSKSKMLRINPDQQRGPRGGHHFQVPNGPMLRDEEFKGLVKKLVDYRVNNLIPLGAPDQEILRYYEKEFPYVVQETPQAERGGLTEAFTAWARWVRRAWRTPPKKTITTKEASCRWEVCQKCKHNKPFNWSDTPESMAMSQRAFLLRRGLEVPNGLGFCDLHCCDISVMSFIDNPKGFSEKPESESQPESCWVV